MRKHQNDAYAHNFCHVLGDFKNISTASIKND